MARRLTDEEWVVLIKAHPELAALPADLRRHADHIVAAAGVPVFRLGERPARFLWVLEGQVRLVRRSRNGAEIVLQRAHSGFVAEASVESHRYHCDAVAVVDSQLLGFPYRTFPASAPSRHRISDFLDDQAGARSALAALSM